MTNNFGGVIVAPDADMRQEVHTLLETDQSLTGLPTLEILETLDRCLAAAHELGLTQFHEIAASQADIVKAVCGVDSLGAIATSLGLEEMHKVRNTLLGALLLVQGSAPALATDLQNLAPQLRNFTSSKRPMKAHEELLTRLGTYATWKKGGRSQIVAIRAALLACAATSSETTNVAPSDFDDVTNPTLLTLKGAGSFAVARQVAVPSWVRPLLAEVLQEHLSRHVGAFYAPIGYAGSHAPGSDRATSASSSTISGFFESVGLGASGLEPHSIRHTRIRWVLMSQGVRPAVETGGLKKLDALCRITDTPFGDLQLSRVESAI